METSTTNTLYEARTNRNMTQAQLADVFGCNVHTISRYETGAREPSLEMAMRLAKYFDMTVETLFNLKEDAK